MLSISFVALLWSGRGITGESSYSCRTLVASVTVSHKVTALAETLALHSFVALYNLGTKGVSKKGSQNGGVDCDRGKKRHERRRTRKQHKVVRTEDQGLEMPTFDTSGREGHGYGLASVARHMNEVSARVRHENLHPWPERDISLSAPLASLASLAGSAGIYACQGEFVMFSDRLRRAANPGHGITRHEASHARTYSGPGSSARCICH